MNGLRKSLVLLVILIFLTSTIALTANVTLMLLAKGQSSWNTQTVTTGGSFGPIYMSLDSNNNPHLIYGGVNDLLYYASWNGQKWNIQSIIQGGTPNQLLLDSNNTPYILYKGSNDITYYATLNGSNWVFQTVPEGYGYSLALDSKDKPHLAYAHSLLVSQYPQGITNNVAMLRYASWNNSNWDIQTLDSPTSRSDSIYLALDKNDNPHIMYGYDTYYPPSGGYTSSVKFAVWNGIRWNIKTALTDLDYFGNIALDSNGGTHFIYAIHYPHESTINATLGYASWDGTNLHTQSVTTNNPLGMFSQANLALDSHNNPHIEFFNGSLMYASLVNTNWNTQTVAPDNFAYGEGPLVLDSKDNPLICYWVDDIRNTTAFVSQLLITSPIQLTTQEPKPSPTNINSGPTISGSASKLWQFLSTYSEIISPIALNGNIYFLSGNSAAYPAVLYCLDATTGTKVWNYTGYLNGFTVVGDKVYVGGAFTQGSILSLQGFISCLNAYSGVQVWNYSDGTTFTSPLANNEIVYAGGFHYTYSSGVNVGFLYAFNALTGEKLWSFAGSTSTRFDSNHLILEDTKLYALSAAYSEQDASWHSSIYAFNANSGEALWNYTTPGQFSSFAVSDQNLLISSNFVDTRNYLDAEKSGGFIYEGGVLALNAQSGVRIWNYPISNSVGTPFILNNIVYTVSGDGVVYAFNALDGSVVWSYTSGTGLGSLLSANGYLYVGSSSGVYCFIADNGRVVWNFAISDFAESSGTNPIFADNLIYVGWNGPMFFSPTTKHNFYALDAWTGQKVWNYTLAYTVSSKPIVMGDTVYVGGNFVSTRNPDFEGSGAIYALKSNSASLQFVSPSAIPTSTPTIPEYPSSSILLPFVTGIIISIAGLIIHLRKHMEVGPHEE
jgi:outer membrane protein assembly factor BamB